MELKKTGRQGEALLSQLFFEPFAVDINTFMPLPKEEKDIKTIFIIIYVLTASYVTEHKENSTLHREVKGRSTPRFLCICSVWLLKWLASPPHLLVCGAITKSPFISPSLET